MKEIRNPLHEIRRTYTFIIQNNWNRRTQLSRQNRGWSANIPTGQKRIRKALLSTCFLARGFDAVYWMKTWMQPTDMLNPKLAEDITASPGVTTSLFSFLFSEDLWEIVHFQNTCVCSALNQEPEYNAQNWIVQAKNRLQRDRTQQVNDGSIELHSRFTDGKSEVSTLILRKTLMPESSLVCKAAMSR
jgi:hypothetical protein